MNLYLISQKENSGYDIYDSAVVVAESEEDAKSIHPSGCDDVVPYSNVQHDDQDDQMDNWCFRDNVQVKLIGVASESLLRGVVCASNSGG